jgi:hypothetical protein
VSRLQGWNDSLARKYCLFDAFSDASCVRVHGVQFNPANVEAEWQPSFFNLEVELLLEGLQGAETCDVYRFHVERGYGTQYFTQVRDNCVRELRLHGGFDASLAAVSHRLHR